MANNLEKLIEASFVIEDYPTLEALVDTLQDGNVLL